MLPAGGGYMLSRSMEQPTAAELLSNVNNTVLVQCLNELAEAAVLQFQMAEKMQAGVMKIMDELAVVRNKRQSGQEVDQLPKQVSTTNDACSEQVSGCAKEVIVPTVQCMLSVTKVTEKDDDDDDDDEDDDDEDYEEEEDDDDDKVAAGDDDQDVEGDEEEVDDEGGEDEGETEDNGEGEDDDDEEGDEDEMDGDEDGDEEEAEDEVGEDGEDDDEAEEESEEEVSESEPPKKKRK